MAKKNKWWISQKWPEIKVSQQRHLKTGMLESHSREPVQPMQAWKIDFKSNMMMMLQECFLILLQYFLSITFLSLIQSSSMMMMMALQSLWFYILWLKYFMKYKSWKIWMQMNGGGLFWVKNLIDGSHIRSIIFCCSGKD